MFPQGRAIKKNMSQSHSSFSNQVQHGAFQQPSYPVSPSALNKQLQNNQPTNQPTNQPNKQTKHLITIEPLCPDHASRPLQQSQPLSPWDGRRRRLKQQSCEEKIQRRWRDDKDIRTTIKLSSLNGDVAVQESPPPQKKWTFMLLT